MLWEQGPQTITTITLSLLDYEAITTITQTISTITFVHCR